MPQFHIQLRAALLVCGLTVTPAVAQVLAPTAQFDQTSRAHRFVDRFNAANTTHDGRLTLEQAQAARMPMLVRRFHKIDTQHKGYITLSDIRAYRRQMHADRAGGNKCSFFCNGPSCVNPFRA